MIKRWLRDTRMGYITFQAGIMRRMLREEGGWQSHLLKTSEYIQLAVKEQQPKSIRILGSGWLLDVSKGVIELYSQILPIPIKLSTNTQSIRISSLKLLI